MLFNPATLRSQRLLYNKISIFFPGSPTALVQREENKEKHKGNDNILFMTSGWDFFVVVVFF